MEAYRSHVCMYLLGFGKILNKILIMIAARSIRTKRYLNFENNAKELDKLLDHVQESKVY